MNIGHLLVKILTGAFFAIFWIAVFAIVTYFDIGPSSPRTKSGRIFANIAAILQLVLVFGGAIVIFVLCLQ